MIEQLKQPNHIINPVELALREQVSSALSLYDETLGDWKPSDKDDIRVACYRDSMFMARLVFPSAFKGEMSPLHKEVFNVYDNYIAGKLGYNKVLIMGPRGFGKSTIGEFFSMHQILFGESCFLMYLSHSLEGGAELRTESIRVQLLTNEVARHLWNPIETDFYDSSAISKVFQFSKKAWVAAGESFVLPRGMGQQVRGVKWGTHRPSFRMLDDLLDRQELSSSNYRKKSKQWFNQDFMHTDSRYDRESFTFYIDTKKHPDDIPTMLERWDDWLKIRLTICEPDEIQECGYRSLVPSFMPQGELDREVQRHRTDPDLSMTMFAQEFMGISQAEEDKSFQGHLKYFKEDSQEFNDRRSASMNVLLIDPSRTSKPSSNPYAFSVVSIDSSGQAFRFLRSYKKYMRPGEFYDEVFELVKIFNIIYVAVEVTGVDEHLTYPLMNEALRKGVYFQLIELRARKGKPLDVSGDDGPKVTRAYGLLRKAQRGLIYLNQQGCGDLEKACLSFPTCSGWEWDVLDSAAYLDQLLDEINLFMFPEDSEDVEEPEEEYADLGPDEAPLPPSWRRV